eukprot:scaffold550_cov303-Pavlova_lutheri.AAC.6
MDGWDRSEKYGFVPHPQPRTGGGDPMPIPPPQPLQRDPTPNCRTRRGGRSKTTTGQTRPQGMGMGRPYERRTLHSSLPATTDRREVLPHPRTSSTKVEPKKERPKIPKGVA